MGKRRLIAEVLMVFAIVYSALKLVSFLEQGSDVWFWELLALVCFVGAWLLWPGRVGRRR